MTKYQIEIWPFHRVFPLYLILNLLKHTFWNYSIGLISKDINYFNMMEFISLINSFSSLIFNK